MSFEAPTSATALMKALQAMRRANRALSHGADDKTRSDGSGQGPVVPRFHFVGSARTPNARTSEGVKGKGRFSFTTEELDSIYAQCGKQVPKWNELRAKYPPADSKLAHLQFTRDIQREIKQANIPYIGHDHHHDEVYSQIGAMAAYALAALSAGHNNRAIAILQIIVSAAMYERERTRTRVKRRVSKALGVDL
ncbi:hypothetical protein GGI24_001285 [Coemansia furcata]|nr:hypothetical protein GGI24_001285 [Coemansia furcata]